MKRMLIIGGTGIVGRPLVEKALGSGYYVSVIANSGGRDLPKDAQFYHIDRRSNVFGEIVKEITRGVREWEAVVDINPYTAADALNLMNAVGKRANHYFSMSTTLVYDRSKVSFRPISEDHPFAQRGEQGGYVDNKVEIERILTGADLNWTILRPYHILGAGSLLGCAPPHNRDPQLVERIRSGERISLCDGGRIPLNVVHPKDLGELVVEAVGNPKTFGKAYNVVNPTEVLVRDYLKEIADQLGCSIRFKSERAEGFWKNPNGWSLTSFPHLYDTSSLERDVGFVPDTTLRNCVIDALQSVPDFNEPVNSTEDGILDLLVHKNMNRAPFPRRHIDYIEE